MPERATTRVVAAAAVALLGLACHETPLVETVPVARHALVVPILADGSLESPPGGEVHAAVGGIAGAVLVREGDRVAAGTPLVRIDNPELEQRVLAGRQELAQLSAQAASNAIERAAAERETQRLRSIVESDARLVKAGAITAEQKAAGELAWHQAEEKGRQIAAQSADIDKRKQLVEQSTRALEGRVASLLLRAPAAGIVYNLPRVAGESIAPGQLVATVTDPQHVRIRARVDAPDLPRVRAGQRLVVTFDGAPGRRWDGSVVLVPPGLRDVGGREVGEVLGELSGDAAVLPSNASVNVEIVVGEKPSALVIPRGALQREGAARVVYRFVDGKASRAAVEVGLIGPNEVEVLNGLHEGDVVILPSAVALHDGEAVRAAADSQVGARKL
jgi:RND family efflux transporter MFP subunit